MKHRHYTQNPFLWAELTCASRRHLLRLRYLLYFHSSTCTNRKPENVSEFLSSVHLDGCDSWYKCLRRSKDLVLIFGNLEDRSALSVGRREAILNQSGLLATCDDPMLYLHRSIGYRCSSRVLNGDD